MNGTSPRHRTTKRFASAALVIGSTVAVLASPLAIGTASAATGALAFDAGQTPQTIHPGATATITGTWSTFTAQPTVTWTVTAGPDSGATAGCAVASGPNTFSCSVPNVYAPNSDAGTANTVSIVGHNSGDTDSTPIVATINYDNTSSIAPDSSVTIDPSSQNQNVASPNSATINVHYLPVPAANQSAPQIYLTTNSGADGQARPHGVLCKTKLDGTARCTLPNTNPGVDNVSAFADNNGTGQLDATVPADVESASTTVTFTGHPAAVTISGASNIATARSCVVYTITATDSLGHPAVGQNITVTVNETVNGTTSPPITTPTVTFYDADCASNAVSTGSFVPGASTSTVSVSRPTPVTTGSNGTVKLGIAANNPSTGTGNNVTASYLSLAISGSQPMTWTAGGADAVTHLTATPGSRTQYTNTSASFTVTALDASNIPVQGVQVNRVITSGPDTNATPFPCGFTVANGTTTCMVPNGGTAGTDVATFWVDNTAAGNHTNGPDANEPQTSVSAIFNTPPTITSAALSCVDQHIGPNQGMPVSGGTHCTVSTAQKSVTFTETLKNGTTPVSGAVVDFSALGATLGGQTPPSLPSGSATTGANGTATFTVNDPNAANGDTVTMQAMVGNQLVGNATADWQSPTASALAVTPPVQSVTKGGNVSVTAQVTDQFGTGVSGTNSLNWVVSGRNGRSGNVSTDSTGSALISYTDAGTNASATTDQISVVDQTNPVSGSASVLYVNGSTTASAVSIDTSGSGTSDGTCALAGHTPAANVALGATTTVCAFVRNAGGEVLAGKSVTFTVSTGQVAKHGGLTSASTTSVTVPTDIAGVAFADVTSTKSGAQTVSAAVDAVSSSSTVTYVVPTADKARNVAVTPSPKTVTAGTQQKFTATVTDAFGNPVPNVTVLFTQSGPGNIGGSSSASLTTAADGTASVTLSTASTDSGAGSVVANITANPANQCGQLANAGTPPATTAGNCTGTATYTVSHVVPASLVIAVAGQHKVGSQELIAATVKNSDGTPATSQVVRFTVSGANSASGSGGTTPKGVAFIAYTPAHTGTDHISAYDDVNNNGVKDAGEPSGTFSLGIVSSLAEKPTIRLTSKNGRVTVHVVSRPSLSDAGVSYYVERLGVFEKIGSNRTGPGGHAHKTFRASPGQKLTFKAKVSGKHGVKSGKSPAKSIRVQG